MNAASSPVAVRVSDESVRHVAEHHGVCVRPIAQRVTDTLTGTVRVVAVPCGSTRAKVCPSCAERARQARYWQCREGWHLTDDPDTEPDDDSADEDENEVDGDDLEAPDDDSGVLRDRVVRSTRRREDVAEFPVRPKRSGTIGRSFTGNDGRTYTPSMFITLTLPSYGRVDSHGVPRDPISYDYRRAALDAMHFAKLVDRFVQNLRRCAGYKVQYFAAVEPQRRGAPHLHMAIRGTLPRADLRQVIAATYQQVWWPPMDEPVYTDPVTYPVWDDRIGGYVDPATGAVLPTWDEALPGLDDDPAHVVRFGSQADIQGLIAGDKADRRIGYLTKYLSKSLADDLDDDQADDEAEADEDPVAARVRAARRAHLDRIHDQTRWLPCSPTCANWLRYGIQPKHAERGMEPGACPRKTHDRDHLGHGGRRVLVSRHWTGKTLGQAKADRATVVRETLAAAGITADDHDQLSATATRPDGTPRYTWEPIKPGDLDTVTYGRLITTAIRQRQRWREQYERARTLIDRPPGDLSATRPQRAASAA